MRLLSALFALFAMNTILAAESPDDFRLTATIMQKIQAIDAEAKRLGIDGRDDDDEDSDDEEEAQSDRQAIAMMVRRIEADPERRAVLAKHGLSARELALGVHALLHAGTYLAFEKSMDRQAGARLLAGYTPAQRANIELLRSQQAQAR